MPTSKQTELSRSTRLAAIITGLVRLALVVAAIIAGGSGHVTVLFASLGVLALTFVPSAIASSVNVRLPLQFELAATIFIYAAIFLGEIGGYYRRFWWWDVVLHTGSAFAFGFAGFLILYLLAVQNKIKASPFWLSLFAFTFALAIGALWEIFEFAGDTILGTNMQKSGLRDTMADLIVDSIGALVASTIGYIYLKYKIRDPFDLFIKWFFQANPRLTYRQPSTVTQKRSTRSK